MLNDNTKGKSRQVVKVEPVWIEYMRGLEAYVTPYGKEWADVTYMEKMPAKGKGGRKEAQTDTKQAANIRRAMKKLKQIICENFGQDLAKEAHITLTYKGKMADNDKLYQDFKEFMRRFRLLYPTHNWEYVAVMEPHGHGGWHIHALVKSDKPIWYDQGGNVSYSRVRDEWRKANKTGAGAVRFTKLPSDVNNFGKYFVMYFTQAIPEAIELSGDRKAIKEAAEESKAVQKGSRLKFYPPDFKFYRCSRGIIRPNTAIEEIGEQMMMVNPKNEARYLIYNEDGKITQTIQTMEVTYGRDHERRWHTWE